MKKIIFLFVLVVVFFTTSSAGNLTTNQLVKLVRATSISTISSIANENGYKLAYKHSGARGWENYDVTDMAWAYNAKYVPVINNWDYSGNFTAIKLLYNNTSKMPESIVYVLSSGTEFHKIKTQISTFGFEFYNEDINTFPNAVAYCYYNNQLRMYAIFVEYFNNGGYQIHFYRE